MVRAGLHHAGGFPRQRTKRPRTVSIRRKQDTSPLKSNFHHQFRNANSTVNGRVRRPDEVSTYILSSTSSRTPLITLWTASWCPSCRIVLPLLNSLISSGVGEAEGGVAHCEVEFDSSEIMDSDFGMQYMNKHADTLDVRQGRGYGAEQDHGCVKDET